MSDKPFGKVVGGVGAAGSGESTRPRETRLKEKFANNLRQAVAKLRPTLPVQDGKFTPDLRQVGLGYLQEGEFAQFLTGDRAEFSTYGMDEEERRRATLSYDASRGVLVDSDGIPATIENRIYNITKEGALIVQPLEIAGAFNHSSITRDGAVISAGYISVAGGKITMINTGSGHYTPTDLDLYNGVRTLQSKGDGVFADDVRISGYSSGDKSLSSFLSYMEEVLPSGESRVEELRRERVREHENIGKQVIIDCRDADTLSALRDSPHLNQNIIFRFRKEHLPADFVSDYAMNLYQKAGQEDRIRTINLRPEQLFGIILRKEPGPDQDAILHCMIEKGICEREQFLANLNEFSANPTIAAGVVRYCMANFNEKNIKALAKLSFWGRDPESKLPEFLMADERRNLVFSSLDSWSCADLFSKLRDKTKAGVIVEELFARDDWKSLDIIKEISRRDKVIAERFIESENLPKLFTPQVSPNSIIGLMLELKPESQVRLLETALGVKNSTAEGFLIQSLGFNINPDVKRRVADNLLADKTRDNNISYVFLYAGKESQRSLVEELKRDERPNSRKILNDLLTTDRMPPEYKDEIGAFLREAAHASVRSGASALASHSGASSSSAARASAPVVGGAGRG